MKHGAIHYKEINSENFKKRKKILQTLQVIMQTLAKKVVKK